MRQFINLVIAKRHSGKRLEPGLEFAKLSSALLDLTRPLTRGRGKIDGKMKNVFTVQRIVRHCPDDAEVESSLIRKTATFLCGKKYRSNIIQLQRARI